MSARSRSRRAMTIAGITAILAAATPSVAADIQRTPRGTTGVIDISSNTPIRAKAIRDTSSAVLVRVNPLGGERYRIEYIGVIEGSFDLAPLIEQADGNPATALPALGVEIYSQLPPLHGTDVFGLSAPGFSLARHYTSVLGAIVVLWAAVPVWFIVRRLLRPKPPAPPLPAREPTVAERLFAIVDEARGRELDAAERGRLELLLLRELRTTDALRDLADAVRALRDDEATAAVVRAVEAWLHAPTAGDRARALDEIDSLRLTPPRVAQGGRA
jgi:hypothetical protein